MSIGKHSSEAIFSFFWHRTKSQIKQLSPLEMEESEMCKEPNYAKCPFTNLGVVFFLQVVGNVHLYKEI